MAKWRKGKWTLERKGNDYLLFEQETQVVSIHKDELADVVNVMRRALKRNTQNHLKPEKLEPDEWFEDERPRRNSSRIHTHRRRPSKVRGDF
jgi:hypothetical protein